MSLASVAYLKSQLAVSKGLGDRSISSDAQLVIDGFEYLTMLIKSFPWPVVSTAGEVEIYLPSGQKTFQPQVPETGMQGQFILTETVYGHAQDAIIQLAGGLIFDATAYEGSPDYFTRACVINSCFMKVEPAERDFESRSQVTQYTGTIFYNFFGEIILGNARPNPV